MIKTFCDCCDDEIAGKNEPPISGLFFGKRKDLFSTGYFKVRVESICHRAETNDEKHICKYCLIDAVNLNDDRGD